MNTEQYTTEQLSDMITAYGWGIHEKRDNKWNHCCLEFDKTEMKGWLSP